MLILTSGVPQGPILDPWLFLLYRNDIAFCNDKITIYLFADDSTLHEAGFNLTEIEHKLQNDLSCIEGWCKANNMSLHTTKSKCMVTSYKTKRAFNLHLTINGMSLKNVNNHKLLGILKWSSQIDFVCNCFLNFAFKESCLLPYWWYEVFVLQFIYTSATWLLLSYLGEKATDRR